MSKLVSVITPCFNGELFVGRYIESVDDGSTDGTASIVQGYKDRLESENIRFHYIYQENAGLAGAINPGLSRFEGDYLIWVDCDDYLFPHSISKRVAFLEEHPEFGLVRSDGVKTNEKAPYKPIWCISNKRSNRFNTAIFEDLLLSRTFITPGCYMVRKSAFLDTHPTRSIYPSRTGQSYQMLLPITFKYRCGYIDEPLWAYVKRADSLNRIDTATPEKKLERIEGCE
ncbi:MAG: glycosyltransferase family 2 protein, partial [Planctomycetota bacterium]